MKKFDFLKKQYREKYIEKRLLIIPQKDFWNMFHYQNLSSNFFLRNQELIIDLVGEYSYYWALFKSWKTNSIPEDFLEQNYNYIIKHVGKYMLSCEVRSEQFVKNHLEDLDMQVLLDYNNFISNEVKDDIRFLMDIIC